MWRANFLLSRLSTKLLIRLVNSALILHMMILSIQGASYWQPLQLNYVALFQAATMAVTVGTSGTRSIITERDLLTIIAMVDLPTLLRIRTMDLL